ncbi:MAG: terminase small subunit [Citrobacter amalonaticus]|jgi:phage terminase small subunit|nr:terminase small subunit [Citrobacter amalonaticus]
MALSDKWERFCREYLLDLNGTQAAIRTGYSAKTANAQAGRLLSNPKIKERIAELKNERNTQLSVDAAYVLRRLVEIDQLDVIDIINDDMSFKPVSEWPVSWRRYLSGFDVAELFDGRGEDREMIGLLKKIKWPDKVKNLELLGKHVDIRAFSDRVEVEDVTPAKDPVKRRSRIRELLNRGKPGKPGGTS